MRTTLNIDDALLKRAMELTGESQKTAVVNMALKALISRVAARELMQIGGSQTNFETAPRHQRVAESQAKYYVSDNS